jgi:hypothetical protein
MARLPHYYVTFIDPATSSREPHFYVNPINPADTTTLPRYYVKPVLAGDTKQPHYYVAFASGSQQAHWNVSIIEDDLTELIPNTTFSADTGWTKGASITISGGTANWGGSNANLTLNPAPSLTAGGLYLVKQSVVAFTSGTVRAQLVGASTVQTAARNAVGHYASVLVCPASPTAFRFFGSGAATFSIDNVSLKRIG